MRVFKFIPTYCTNALLEKESPVRKLAFMPPSYRNKGTKGRRAKITMLLSIPELERKRQVLGGQTLAEEVQR